MRNIIPWKINHWASFTLLQVQVYLVFPISYVSGIRLQDFCFQLALERHERLSFLILRQWTRKLQKHDFRELQSPRVKMELNLMKWNILSKERSEPQLLGSLEKQWKTRNPPEAIVRRSQQTCNDWWWTSRTEHMPPGSAAEPFSVPYLPLASVLH